MIFPILVDQSLKICNLSARITSCLSKKSAFFFFWSFGAVSRSGFVFPFGFLLSTRTYKDKLAANSEVLKSEYRKRQTWCNKTFLECSALPKLFFFPKGFLFDNFIHLEPLLMKPRLCKTELCHCISHYFLSF